eukprot:CAMPEP_0176364592 /NCGR_PEP_ID=MMETSP0126-20121128/19893_1 /TAXON_ID=141414 ORGANISM="Strombidinopsis acuminatum, Strain SPMC142" /NCGR_SAMPLE_ID=MMETSP0126 /ASSEMBLY_ACC=CAM_ASM_000229 /LENGTH=126 /DNA_ID=CAMNT_0017721285 /DNA_START=39 /DNA_END=419 /DNA_ORIENTATION=+
MGLRSDLDKAEKNQCLAICKDIIENFKEDNLEAQNNKSKGKSLFSQLDTTAAEKASGADDCEASFDLNAFLNEGGFAEEKKKMKEEAKAEESDDLSEEEEEKQDTTPDENMCGSLGFEKTKLGGGD